MTEKEYKAHKQRIENLPDDTLFYIQSYGYVGNCLNLWALEGKGYTTDIDKAQLYNKEEVLGQLSCRRDQDNYYPAQELQKHAKRRVDHQDIGSNNKY